jgi:hypothetical protein
MLQFRRNDVDFKAEGYLTTAGKTLGGRSEYFFLAVKIRLKIGSLDIFQRA